MALGAFESDFGISNFFAGLGQTSVRGGDPRINSSTSMDDFKRFCNSDITAGNPNSQACNTVAANSPRSDNEALCNRGVSAACRIAGTPELTSEQRAELARNRDEDAQREKEHTARKLENTCDLFNNPSACFRIAEAIRTGREVVYAQDISDAEEQLRAAGQSPEDIKDIVGELESRLPWYERVLDTHRPWYNKRWVWAIGATTMIGTALYIGNYF